MIQLFKEFCGETSIHGFYHISNDKSNVLTRILWFIVFVASLTYAAFMLEASFKGNFPLLSDIQKD